MRNGSPFWWAVFIHNRKEIRTSTKHSDFEKAKAVAIQWYMVKQNDLSKGISPTHNTKTFAYAVDKAYVEYHADIGKKGRSKSYVLGIKKAFNKLKKLSLSKVDIAAVNHTTWENARKELLIGNPALSDRTLHQYRNAIQIVLNQAYKRGDIKRLPEFLSGATDDTPRTFFNKDEYDQLTTAILKHIAKKMKEKNGWTEAARELLDYVEP
jgi:hypothetical protein